MSIPKCALQRLRTHILNWRFRMRYRAKRLTWSWRYFRDSLSADEAQQILIDCHYPAGWHPLLTLAVEDTLEQARETFADHPDLARLVADGCARVGYKWESYSEELFEARRWAIDLAEGYAADEGITLVRLDENTNAGKVGEHTP